MVRVIAIPSMAMKGQAPGRFCFGNASDTGEPLCLLAKAEVSIERMIDPKVNEKATLKALDNLAQAIRTRFPQPDEPLAG